MSLDSGASFSRKNEEFERRHDNSSKFSTLKKPAKFAQATKNSQLNATAKPDKMQSFGNRKRTMEDNSKLDVLSKQLRQTEKTLDSVSRKQSQQISTIHETIKVLKEELSQHKKPEPYYEVRNATKTPNNQSRVKNMSKYLQSKSRNTMSSVKASKTQEKLPNKKNYKPFTSMMLKSFSRASITNSTSKRATVSKVPKYIEQAYKRAIQSLDSSPEKHSN